MQSKILPIMEFKCLKDCINMSSSFELMNILKMKDINIYEHKMAKFMYLYYHHKLSQNFDQYIKPAATHHKYVTRSITNKTFYCICKDKIYHMANALAVLMELKFGIKFL